MQYISSSSFWSMSVASSSFLLGNSRKAENHLPNMSNFLCLLEASSPTRHSRLLRIPWIPWSSDESHQGKDSFCHAYICLSWLTSCWKCWLSKPSNQFTGSIWEWFEKLLSECRTNSYIWFNIVSGRGSWIFCMQISTFVWERSRYINTTWNMSNPIERRDVFTFICQTHNWRNGWRLISSMKMINWFAQVSQVKHFRGDL